MADIKPVSEIAELQTSVKEVARAVNTQARLLAEIVKAADHIVKTYLEITKVEEPNEKTKESK